MVAWVLSDYAKRWEHYLSAMSAEQRARFEDIMRGRSRTKQNQREAVDVVMREPAQGICCEACAARIGSGESAALGSQRHFEIEAWQRINQAAFYAEAE